MPPRYLDPRVKLVWFIPTAVALFIIWFVVSISVLILLNDELILGMNKFLFSLSLLAGLCVFIGAPTYIYNHIEYMSFTYEIASTEFIIRQGVITRRTTVIPYNRIQNINTTRNLIERVFGLASLQIETAGANLGLSEAELPGVSKKDSLIAEIMHMVERSKKANVKNGEGLKTELELLGEILKELKALNNNISQAGSSGPAGAKGRAKWEDVSPGLSGISKGNK